MPRIYVADLAAYNAGYLHGTWIDLEPYVDDLEGLTSEVKAMLDKGTELYSRETLSQHEEWAIHDSDGFGPIRIGEYTQLETVLAHAERMGDEPNKYFAWVAARGDSDNYDPDMVFGPYESEDDYFDQWLDNCYGAMDVETVLVKAGVDKRTAESLSQMLEWVSVERFVLDKGNPLVKVSTGDYSYEYYEVAE